MNAFPDDPHSLSVPWVDSPFLPDLLRGAELDPEMKQTDEHFARHGYVIIDPQVPDATIDQTVKDVRDRYKAGADGYYADEKRIQDAWNWSGSVKKIALAPRILEILEVLYRRKPFPFQTLNFRVGSEQRTHSDKAFFDSIPHGFMAGVWVALEDVDESNGPLHYYPSSHRLQTYNLHDLGVLASGQSHALENLSRYEDFVEHLIRAVDIPQQRLKVQKGQALIWASNLYHGGCPILEKGRSRHTQVTHYYFSGCLYYTPLMSDPGIGRLAPRTVFNAEFGREVPQYYQGRLVKNPGQWPPVFADSSVVFRPDETPTRRPRSFIGALRKPIDIVRDLLK